MDVATFRRYLQPSPTLRWHPWAPLGVLLLAFAFVFWMGIKLGVAFGERRASLMTYSYGTFEMMIQKEQVARPSAAVVRRAHIIDNTVRSFVADQERRDIFNRLLDGAVNWSFPGHGKDYRRMLRQSMVNVAEWRLANMSPGTPLWHKTSTYCDDYQNHDFKGPFDVAASYERAASAYTKLLGRTVTSRQLAPDVPGGECK